LSARLLLIDDDVRLTDMLGDYLRRNGYEVEAAASLGAGKLRTLARVTLPVLRPALAAGAALAFLAAFGDFVLSIVLYTYTTRPVSIEILSNLRLQETGVAAVYGVLLTALSAVAFLVFGRERETF
jgi:ABC-type Fe3+ transport system permease subunit